MSCFRNVLVVVLLGIVCALPARADDVPTYSTQSYDVSWPSRVGFPDLDALSKKLNDPALLNGAIKTTWGQEMPAVLEQTHIAVQPGPQGLTLSITAGGPNANDRRLFLLNLAAGAAKVLAREEKMQVDASFARQEVEVDRAAQELAKADAQLRAVRESLRKATGRVDVSPDVLHAAIASLDQEQQKLGLEGAGMSVRQKALEDAVARLTGRAAKTAEEDKVAQQLQVVVATREQALARIMQAYKAGAAPQGEVSAAESALAEAKAKMLERQSAMAQSAGGEALAELNKELVMMSVNVLENQARRQYVKASLDKLAAVTEQIDQLESLMAARGRAQRELNDAQGLLVSMRSQAASARPPYLAPAK